MAVLAHDLTPPTAAAGSARIGPNAIIRTVEVLQEQVGEVATERILVAAGLERYIGHLPGDMVAEDEVIALYAAVRRQLGAERARRILRAAGHRTGEYLLAHRIPRGVQAVLRVLPAAVASRILLNAIGRHAWTFAGSGVLALTPGHPVRFSVQGCPICRGATGTGPQCDFYGATFERLFRDLVAGDATVEETACAAAGAPACAFEIRWGRP